MTYKGELRKMPVALNGKNEVAYQMLLYNTATHQEQAIAMNELIGKNISIHYEGNSGVHQYGYAYFTKTLHTVEAN